MPSDFFFLNLKRIVAFRPNIRKTFFLNEIALVSVKKNNQGNQESSGNQKNKFQGQIPDKENKHTSKKIKCPNNLHKETKVNEKPGFH